MTRRRSHQEIVEAQKETIRKREEKTALLKADLERRLKALEQKDRKKETRLKILMGAFLIDMIQSKASWLPTARLHAEISAWLTRSSDKALYLVWAQSVGLADPDPDPDPHPDPHPDPYLDPYPDPYLDPHP